MLFAFDMFTEQIQTVGVPSPEFHKLTWQLDCIPIDAVRSCYRNMVNFSQHMMQAMAKFME